MMLRVDIGHDFGGFALRAAFHATPGTTVLYGPSGSGKTSIVNAIAGLLKPEQGHITLGDAVLFDRRTGQWVPPHARRIGYVFQDARLFPHMSVAGNLDYGAQFSPEPLDRAARARLIDVLDIGSLLDRRPGHLSGGEAQRVALGRALMSGPRLLLMDEPLAGLDTARKEEILPYLEHLKAEGGPPMLYVTHDMSELVRLADSLIILRNGTCAAQGLAEDVLADPANVPLIGVQDAGALLSGVLSDHAADGLSALTLSDGTLYLPHIDAPVGSTVRVRVRAQDVIISVSPPVGLSTQNALKAEITALHQGTGPSVAIGLRSGSDRLLARITSRAMGQLNLSVGQPVWAILKASAMARGQIASEGTKRPKSP